MSKKSAALAKNLLVACNTDKKPFNIASYDITKLTLGFGKDLTSLPQEGQTEFLHHHAATVKQVSHSVHVETGGFAIRESKIPKAGSGVFATADIKQDQIVYHNNKLLVQCVDTRHTLVYTCENCFWMPDKEMHKATGIVSRNSTRKPIYLLTCANCHHVRYCSKPCQTRAWKNRHRIECNNSLPHCDKPEIALSNRLLIEIENGTITQTQLKQSNRLINDRWTIFGEEDEHHGDGHLGDTRELAEGFKKASKSSLPLTEIADVVGCVYTNMKELRTSCGGVVDKAIDICSSPLNHSCRPSVSMMHNKGRIEVRATRVIRKGDELLMTYVEPPEWVMERQILLFRHWHFYCNCERCIVDHAELKCAGIGDDMLKQRHKALIAINNEWLELPNELRDDGFHLEKLDRSLAKLEMLAREIVPRTLEPFPFIYLEFAKYYLWIAKPKRALKLAVKALAAWNSERQSRYFEALKMLAHHILPGPQLALQGAYHGELEMEVSLPQAPMMAEFIDDRVNVRIVSAGYAYFMVEEAMKLLGKDSESITTLYKNLIKTQSHLVGFSFVSEKKFRDPFYLAQEKMLKWAGIPLDKGMSMEWILNRLNTAGLKGEIDGLSLT